MQPLLLVFEDLHWIDSETQALLDTLVESLPTAQLLLLASYRPEYQHDWGSKTSYTQLRLDPLSPASTNALLKALLGDDPSLAPITQLLIARTQGNPFFLEESVRTLVETQVLARHAGSLSPGPGAPKYSGASHGAGSARGAHRPTTARGKTALADRGGHWHRGVPAAVAGYCRGVRRRYVPRPRASPGG